MTAKFWVGGTGTWDNSTTTHWSLSTGGANGAAVPGAGDTITFDASSGGGTVTVDTTINGLTFTSITMGAFTGTLDFSINNPSITLTNFSVTGAGTRALKLGSGTFTLTGTNVNNWDATTTTGLTLTAGTSTIFIGTPGNGNPQTFAGGGLSYATVSIGSRTNASKVNISGNNTIATLSIAAPVYVGFTNTQTITNAINWAGSSSASALLFDGGTVAATLAVAVGSTINWAGLRFLTFTGTTVPATNSFDLQGVTGATITAPGGSVGVIGS